MKLSDYKGTDAVELLADLLEPIGKIFSDEETVKVFRNQQNNDNKMGLVKLILKRHSKEIVEILAIIDGEDPATYSPNFFVLPQRLLELFNDEEFTSLFISQGQNANDLSSGSVTANTKEDENG